MFHDVADEREKHITEEVSQQKGYIREKTKKGKRKKSRWRESKPSKLVSLVKVIEMHEGVL